MTTTELLRLEERITIGIDVGESHFREFKSACSRNAELSMVPRNVKDICEDVGEVLVAFANADGGELFVGVEDDGIITGVPHKENLVDAIKRAYISHVHNETPLPLPIIGDIVIDGRRIIYFSVLKSTGQVHLTANGRCLRRYDRENRPVGHHKIMAAREESISREYDRGFVDGVTTGDLDIDLLRYAADQIAPGYSPEKLLQYLGLAEYGEVGLRYRKATVLLYAKDISRWHPRCQVRILRVQGTTLGTGEQYNVVADDLISGAIPKLIDDAWDALRPYLARTRFQSSGLFRESLIYPETACREALVNAVVHRDYSREGSPVEIFVYDDRMDFKSPGGLLSGISIDQLNSLAQVHETRNVLVARSMRELGYVREMGEGILRMFAAMRDNDLVDPELSADAENFVVTLRSRSIFNQQDIEWLEGYKEFDLEKNEQRVVLLGRDGHLLSTNEIINVAGIIDIDDFRALYEQLRMKGIIYSGRSRPVSPGGLRREIGRFRVRPSKETEQFLGELFQALKTIGPTTMLDREHVASVRSKLSPASPYKDRPNLSLQAMGFIDAQRRFLPKAFSYVPELEEPSPSIERPLSGRITSAKSGRYGFIRGDNGVDYFFHFTDFAHDIEWDDVKVNQRVSFVPEATSIPGRSDPARQIELL